MNWNQSFPKTTQPSTAQIDDYVATPLWRELRQHLEETYGVAPAIEHSLCSAAPGWNVKYKKGGRALCTLYPEAGAFTCMVSIGSREAMEAELLLSGCTGYVQALYWGARPFNGGRWLMIAVSSPEILSDTKHLISTRAHRRPAQIK